MLREQLVFHGHTKLFELTYSTFAIELQYMYKKCFPLDGQITSSGGNRLKFYNRLSEIIGLLQLIDHRL